MTTARTQLRRHRDPRMSLIRSMLGGGAMSVAIVGAAVSQKPAAPANVRDFDAYVAKAMKDWKVPGMAIPIGRNDSIVFARGYGVRKLGDATPVDPPYGVRDRLRVEGVHGGNGGDAGGKRQAEAGRAHCRRVAGSWRWYPGRLLHDYTLEGDRVKRVTLVQPAPQPTLVLTPVS